MVKSCKIKIKFMRNVKYKFKMKQEDNNKQQFLQNPVYINYCILVENQQVNNIGKK